MSTRPKGTATPGGGAWQPGRRGLTVALVGSVTLVGSEILAVATAMPAVAADLGRGGYGLVFSLFSVASIVGVLLAGPAADRRGPWVPFATGMGLFGVELAVGGAAPTMAVLLAGRVLRVAMGVRRPSAAGNAGSPSPKVPLRPGNRRSGRGWLTRCALPGESAVDAQGWGAAIMNGAEPRPGEASSCAPLSRGPRGGAALAFREVPASPPARLAGPAEAMNRPRRTMRTAPSTGRWATQSRTRGSPVMSTI